MVSRLQVKRFEVHKSRVNDISFDEAEEYLASCSDDGSAAVRFPATMIIAVWHKFPPKNRHRLYPSVRK